MKYLNLNMVVTPQDVTYILFIHLTRKTKQKTQCVKAYSHDPILSDPIYF